MTHQVGNVRGTARPRDGATDTTMLIWKVIEANPGIDREGIRKRVEHRIPEGYALRYYTRHRQGNGALSYRIDGSDRQLEAARWYVLGRLLDNMRKGGVSVSWEGDGNERRYTAIGPPRYKGNPEAVDVDGSKMTEHMAIANSLPVLRRLISRQNISDKDKATLTALINALQAKGGALCASAAPGGPATASATAPPVTSASRPLDHSTPTGQGR